MVAATPTAIAPFATHGGRLDAARAAYPGAVDWIDLSTGIAPWSYPAAVTDEAPARLPSPADLAALEAAAATAFGADPASTVAVPGSDLGLRLLGHILGERRTAVVRPGYSGHAAMWATPPTAIAAADIRDAAARYDVIALARPNNPDGAVADSAMLAAVATELARRGGHLIVDEAFVDAVDEPGIASYDWPDTIVLRSFGKFFGLAGLRLGFVIAPPAIARALRALLGDWPISGPAIAVGTAAYRDSAWQAIQRTRLDDAGTWLDARLRGAGATILGGTPLFRLAATAQAAGLFTHLATAGILARPFANDAGWLRFGVPTEGDRARVALALDDWSTR